MRDEAVQHCNLSRKIVGFSHIQYFLHGAVLIDIMRTRDKFDIN
jgi:hypothetical protein